ncbi:hypothetical protein [Metabacillus sp. B2-18]|uniref:hypothetical protein n=1 Tax=Metabacillus sp. B2-18 TaxID=2897333 RepID=UPI001E3BF665|nr:hypothetical protein [Metabacillus sp. B2-18]UGB29962.1 hypothetical protein LPC09_19920 [Metabacillus sp. B2-18]
MRRRRVRVNSTKRRRLGYRPSYQLNRMLWEFHAYDDDPFPSIPHGHSLDSEHKLNVDTGEIVLGKQCCGKIKTKEHKRLLNDKRFQKLVLVAKQYHKDKNKRRGRFGYKLTKERRIKSMLFICEVEMEESTDQ